MANAQQVFAEFIATFPSRKDAANALGCSYVLICKVLNGERGISKELAEKIQTVSAGRYSRERMLWGDEQSANKKVA